MTSPPGDDPPMGHLAKWWQRHCSRQFNGVGICPRCGLIGDKCQPGDINYRWCRKFPLTVTELFGIWKRENARG